MSGIKLISSGLFDSVADSAAKSTRQRMNYNFHTTPEDNPHRFLNVLLAGTYIRPHRHLDPPKAESFLVLEGVADVIVFNEGGAITARYRLGDQSAEGKLWGVDLPAGIWHTIVPITARVVCYEVKPGPWVPSTDKEFAPWAPAEGDSAVSVYLASLA